MDHATLPCGQSEPTVHAEADAGSSERVPRKLQLGDALHGGCGREGKIRRHMMWRFMQWFQDSKMTMSNMTSVLCKR